jgi:3-methyladenine DNA glycosylase AlkD
MLAAIAAEAPDPAAARLIEHLRSLGDPHNVEGMGRFGISTASTLGISMVTLRVIARPLVRARRADATWRHEVACALWESGIHEARILAALVEDPGSVTRAQALAWAAGSDSWDITDQLCLNLLWRTPFAYELACEWSAAEETFVKRAAFALIACLAWHDKEASDHAFLPFLDVIESEASDERNFVTKSVDWALRQIGKRSPALHGPALETATRLAERPDRAARRVGRVAARELESQKVRERLGL